MKKATKAIAKTQKKEVAPPDMVQTTILLDRSGSMQSCWSAAKKALEQLTKSVDCSLVSLQTFDNEWEIVKDFEAKNDLGEIAPRGDTNMYGAILRSIGHSRASANLTPEFKAHHVFVVITDGESNSHTESEFEECKKAIKDIDVDATFFLLDSTGGDAGRNLGWASTTFKNTPASIREAIEKCKVTIGQINDNVAKKLDPKSNLLLLPAK